MENLLLLSVPLLKHITLYEMLIGIINTTLVSNRKLLHKMFLLNNDITDEGGLNYLYHGLSACTVDNPLPTSYIQTDKP